MPSSEPPVGDRPEPPAEGDGHPVQPGPSAPSAMDLMATGLTMAILVGGGLGLGLLVDDWLGSSPVATFVGLALGVLFAGVALWERARRYL